MLSSPLFAYFFPLRIRRVKTKLRDDTCEIQIAAKPVFFQTFFNKKNRFRSGASISMPVYVFV